MLIKKLRSRILKNKHSLYLQNISTGTLKCLNEKEKALLESTSFNY